MVSLFCDEGLKGEGGEPVMSFATFKQMMVSAKVV